MPAKRGLFWYIDGQLLCFPFSEEEINETNNNHKRFWKTLPRTVTGGKPYNYYPRGRVELRREKLHRKKAIVYLHPQLCMPEIYGQIRKAFLLPDEMPVSFKADGSQHYSCLH